MGNYISPYMDNSGLHIPSYIDILAELIEGAKAVYGSDIYLGNDSPDYQFLSILALKMSDCLQSAQLAYNNRSPSTAIGAGLDAVVKINGITRKAASYSTCQVIITGTAGAVITNGVVQDINGYKWGLPDSFTIPTVGYINVTATCQTIGAITALPAELTKIASPTAGWISVTNVDPATAGVPTETDSELRSRQALSTMLPSLTTRERTVAAIAALDGVTRYRVYENDTGLTDSLGLPEHSITCVIEGGTDADIAQAIYANRGIGCYLNGSESLTITDMYGIQTIVRWDRPVYVPIYVSVNVHKLASWELGTEELIVAAIAEHLNSLEIGGEVVYSSVYGAALSVLTSLAEPTFSIYGMQIGTATSPPMGTADIELAYDEVAIGYTTDSPLYIEVTFV